MKTLWLFALAIASVIGISTGSQRISYTKFHVTFSTKLNGQVNLSYTFSQERGLTKQDKQAILNIHNALRNTLATGRQRTSYGGPMPTASNMLAMEWDDRLATFAQKWADKCVGDHSDLKVPGAAFRKAAMSENICGDYPAIERDMYGEVKDWNYRTQECRPGAQCGHYVAIASWSHFRMGCGWRVCKSGITSKLILFCDFAPYSSGGLALNPGETRLPSQYEYRSGRPCSECPQGWDFCLAGGLCATKEQCRSDNRNRCRCLHTRRQCQRNNGLFNAQKCTCKCPPNRYGINCKHRCRNPPGNWMCGLTCGGAVAEMFTCPKPCGSCGRTTSRPYRYFFQKHPAVNADGIKTAAFVKDPQLPANPNLRSLPSYGRCQNREANRFCQNILLRNYCKGAINKDKWQYYCGLSCNSCNATAWQRMVQGDINENSAGSKTTSPPSDTGWVGGGGSDGWGDSEDSSSGGTSGGESGGSWGNGGSDSNDGWGDSEGGSDW